MTPIVLFKGEQGLCRENPEGFQHSNLQKGDFGGGFPQHWVNTRLGVELSRYFKIALSTLPWTATTWQAASDFSEKVKNVNGAVNFYFVNFYFVDFLLLFIDSYKIINNENFIIKIMTFKDRIIDLLHKN